MTEKSYRLAEAKNSGLLEGKIKYELPDMSANMSSKSWELGVDREIELVERRIKDLIASNQKILTNVSLHVIDSGGKRLRPTLAILSHHALQGNDLDRLIDIAAALELIHSATLVHDDINDGADLRRGKKSAHKQFGVHEAIVAGDFMFARAFYIGGGFEKRIVEMVADCCKRLAEGEIQQYLSRADTDLSVEQYLRIIEGKTAHPIMTSAIIGAYLANGSDEEIEALGHYGLNIGLAFQIVDDVLDIIGNEKQLGKMTGSDIRERNMTLPVIIARDLDERIAKSLPDVLGMKSQDSSVIDRFLDMVKETGSIKESMEIARKYCSDSIKHLDRIRDSEYKNSLKELAKLVVERSS